MTSVLLAVLGEDAAAQLVGVAEALVQRGNRVAVVSSSTALESFRHIDLDLFPVPDHVSTVPSPRSRSPRLLRRATALRERVQRNVIDPLPSQAAVVKHVIRSAGIDVIVTDAMFLGGSMVSVLPRSARPAVVMLGAFAPWIPDPAVPPYGLGFSPGDDQMNRVRSAAFELLAASTFRRLSRSFNAQVEVAFGRRRRGDLRLAPSGADVWAQLTVPRFEYPRVALPANFRFVGPLSPAPAAAHPEWWDPLREPPVVVVRASGPVTVRDVVLPTISAFDDGEEVVVLVIGASRAEVESAADGPLPSFVHFEARAPWPRLIPRRSVVITDGDYIHCQYALRYGIPVIVAGTLETDVETAARLVWSGAGIDLRTRRPSPALLRASVDRIRTNPSFAIAAAKLAAQIASTHAEREICDLVDELIAVGRVDPAVRRTAGRATAASSGVEAPLEQARAEPGHPGR